MSWRLLLEAGAEAAGTNLTRDDCRRVLAALEAEAQRVCELVNSSSAADVDVAIARGETAEMQRRLLAAEEQLRVEKQRFSDANFADIGQLTCAWCGLPLGDAARERVEAHLRTCSHHPLGETLRRLAAALETLGHFAEAVRELRAETVRRYGAAGYARLMDLARAAYARDPDEVSRLMADHLGEAIRAERECWRRALEEHGLHTLPANECFAKVLEHIEED